MTASLLSAILDRLLPGSSEGWPAAGKLGLAPSVGAFISRTPEGAAWLEVVLAGTAPGFLDMTPAEQTRDLQRLEEAEPEAFERLVVAAYNMYYTHPEVRHVIERLTGYEARPPQPLGSEMEPFDEALLVRQKQRAPFWRRTGGEA